MLIRPAEAETGVIYPVIQTSLIRKQPGGAVESLLPSCCFHDLTSADDHELAGMGLAIIGNLCKTLGKDIYDVNLFAKLELKMASYADPITCPWPGMPDDRPLPLDLTQMPFNTAMFLDEKNQLQWRLDRIKLMHRIREVWVPWLRGKLVLS